MWTLPSLPTSPLARTAGPHPRAGLHAGPPTRAFSDWLAAKPAARAKNPHFDRHAAGRSGPNPVRPTRATLHTRPDPAELVAAWRRMRPELSEQGAHLLLAQVRFETGNFAHCYNWNFGNMKASAHEPHMFLAHVWEAMTPAQAAALARGPHGHLVHVDASGRYSVSQGNVAVVFEPPHPQCRFRAFDFEGGAAAYLDALERCMGMPVEQVVNGGEPHAMVAALKKGRYFTGDPSHYTAGVRRFFDAGPGSSRTPHHAAATYKARA